MNPSLRTPFFQFVSPLATAQPCSAPTLLTITRKPYFFFSFTNKKTQIFWCKNSFYFFANHIQGERHYNWGISFLGRFLPEAFSENVFLYLESVFLSVQSCCLFRIKFPIENQSLWFRECLFRYLTFFGWKRSIDKSV